MAQPDRVPPTKNRHFGLPFAAALALIVIAAALFAWSRWGWHPVAAPPLQGKPAGPEVGAEDLPAIRFTDIADSAGVKFVHRGGATGEKMLPESGGSGCAFFDYDNDGDFDLLLISGRAWPWDEQKAATSTNALALYRNDGEGNFTDVTSEVGLTADFYGQGAAIGDYDADGDDDLFVTAVGANHLFRNDAGHFIDVAAESGIAGNPADWTTSAGFFDYDRDGDLDLFVCNYLHWTRELDQAATLRVPGEGLTYAHPSNFPGTQNYLYRNDDGKFTDVSADAGIDVTDPTTGEPIGKSLALTFVDFDRDGWPDVFVANDTIRHFLFHNRGDGTFDEVGESRGFALNAAGLTTSGMGIDAAWIRNNEELAIAVANFAEEMTSLYVLQGRDDKFFTDETIPVGIGGASRNVLTFGLLFNDFDLDGRVDLVETNGHLEETISAARPSQSYRQSAKLFWNAGTGKRPEFADLPRDKIGDLARPIVGRGLAAADIDGDGDVDLVINQVEGPPLVLRNDQQLGGHWLRCRLEGSPGNPHAIGALVELTAGGVTQRRYVHPTRSYLSQSEPIVTFGLGKSDKVESLAVTWPDGTKQDVKVDDVDRVVTVRPAADEFASLSNTAKALIENGEFEQAVDKLKQALSLRPNSAAMRRNLARAYTLSGQPDLALTVLKQLEAESSTPSAAVAYLSGLAALRQLRYDDAAKHFQEAVELDPNEAALHFQYGIALTALNRTDEARQQFERAAELDPLHGGAQYQLATLARKAGDQEAFARYMRDFQRIRAMKGPSDPLALEECRYTRAEAAESAAPRTRVVAGPAAKFATVDPWSGANADADQIVGLAVLALEDSGRYQLVGVTKSGDVIVFDCDAQGRLTETARSSQSIGPVDDDAVVLVGNALVDGRNRPAGSSSGDENAVGDQPEIVVVTPRQTWFLRYVPGRGVVDLTASSSLSAAHGDTARWADVDHDGDIDLCVGSSDGLKIWRNNSDGQFVDVTQESGVADSGPCVDFAAIELDGTNLGVDLVIAGPQSTTIYRNQFGGRFAEETGPTAALPAATTILADDFDNDDLADIGLLSPEKLTLVITGSNERQQLALGLDQIDAATTIDVDNDGWLDVAVVGLSAGERKLLILRNSGGRFADTPEATTAPATPSRGGLLDADIDGDGRTDLMLTDDNGKLTLLHNETPTTNHQLKLAIRSFAGSPSSIGVRVQVRSGKLVVTRWTSRELPIEIGIGQTTMADSIQTLWMNGIARNEVGVELTGEPVRITIVEFVRTSSCPFLYAWEDEAWQFLTDVLGTSPLNVSAARGIPLPADSDEVVVLGPAEQYAVDNLAARLRLTSELREVVYVDGMRLLAVDHPSDVEVFSRDRVARAGIEGPQFLLGRGPIKPRSAIGSDGVDRTAAVSKEDGVMAEPGEPLPPPLLGFTVPLSIELDFGDLDDSQQLLLALTGWFPFGNSSTNIAASQRGDLKVIWPQLEAAGGDGQWQIVDEAVGFPSGNTKTIVCDLAGKLPHGTKRLRLTTSFEVRWDRIALYHSVPAEAAQVTEVKPTTAMLAWHGFAELRPHAADQPQVPNLTRMSDTPPWFTSVEGWCTRYGEIAPLLAEFDGRQAILNSGDGATLEFPSDRLPKRTPGTARTLLLYTRGWIKEVDPNSLEDRRVEPLPGGDSTSDADESDWQLEYNTRWVPRNQFAPRHEL
jgi:tetratricopeptide (TPR) repeat protein